MNELFPLFALTFARTQEIILFLLTVEQMVIVGSAPVGFARIIDSDFCFKISYFHNDICWR